MNIFGVVAAIAVVVVQRNVVFGIWRAKEKKKGLKVQVYSGFWRYKFV